MNYQLIALDVDGTLLNDQYRLTESTKKTIRKVHETGSTIVLCTGRSPVSSIPVMEELGLSGKLITHNGAATVSSEDQSVLHLFPFDMEEILPMVDYCREHEVHFDVNSAFTMYVESLQSGTKEMYAKFFANPVLVPDALSLDEPIVKFTAFGTEELMDKVEADWRRMDIPHRMIRSGVHFIDVMHIESTKGNALKVLAVQMGIPRERVLAIGNYFNDIDMLEFAGMGIAMDNSPELVKKSADAVTGSNNEDGVHQALTKYCLE